MNNGSNNVPMNVVVKSIVQRIENYSLLTTEPADWNTNWMSYFTIVYNPMSTKPDYFDPTKYFKYSEGSYVPGSASDTWDSIIWYDRRFQAVNTSTKPTFTTNTYYAGAIAYIQDGENIGTTFGKINQLIDHVNSLEMTGVRASELAVVATSGSYLDLSNKPIVSNTTQFWNEHSAITSTADTVYVYTDYDQDALGNPIPGFKLGDGHSYVVNLPFIAGTVTQSMIESWNNKVAVRLTGEDNETLEFYK